MVSEASPAYASAGYLTKPDLHRRMAGEKLLVFLQRVYCWSVCSAGGEDLHEPLLSRDAEGEQDKGHETSTAGPLVPHSINRVDWELLLRSIVNNCQKGWNSVRGMSLSCSC